MNEQTPKTGEDCSRDTEGYPCVCGKTHKSRSTVYMHTSLAKARAQKSREQAEPREQQSEKSREHEQNTPAAGAEHIKKISLKKEFEQMREEIDKKPEQKTASTSNEPNYQCGTCNERFYMAKRPKNCPYCGEKFV